MPLSLNEIRERARAFAKEWAGESSERAEAQSFWNDFFSVFGVNRRRVAVFEQKAARFTGSSCGRIDVFWPGVMLAEHKSRGADLDAAFEQATDYFAGLKDAELPRYVLVSDFQRFRLHDLETGERTDFALADLHKQIGRFGFISGYQTRSYKEEDPVNLQAAERMGRLHDALKAAGYDGHPLEVLLVRLLFCLFADDTGIFPRQSFHDLIVQRTREDGSDLGMWLERIFQVLNTPPEKRQSTLDEQLAELPYVNGRLFEERLPLADFNAQMRGLLLDASTLDWGRISPAIFGAMFQSVMDAKARRNLGAHYTSEKNILKLIGPLFLDGLKAELDKAGHDEKKLAQLHRKLATLTFLDPACGCGNFLVIAYRELRALELEILKRQFATQQSVLAHVQDHVLVDVDQFYGIEIEEFPAQIAQVAMWLMDHQMNLRVSEQFGENVVRLPLKKSATIVHGNALRMDWNDVVPAERLHYILGNPPFVGSKLMSADQREDLRAVAGTLKGAGILDFVSAWYLKAAAAMQANPRIRSAFVSTNSITQGEQVGVLWGELLRRGLRIFFAHRTFRWNNEARGVAAVHCVIIGFAAGEVTPKQLFDYEDIAGEPHRLLAGNINPYLVDAADVLLPNRSKPICDVPEIGIGNKPIDGGNYLFTTEERDAFIAKEPASAAWFRRWLGSDEFINGWERWCLWLGDCPPSELRAMPECLKRVEAVRALRKESRSAPTRKLAETPTRFHVENIPDDNYLVIPEVSSERRTFIPIGFMTPDTLCSNLVKIVPNATPFHFGIVTSTMHMAWVRTVCGRLKSDYRYSAGIVYNNFPWPELGDDDKHRAAIEAAAQGVLDARAQFPEATLADLYDPLTMPPALVKAHAALDKAVDAAYLAAEKAAGRKPPKLSTDAERVAFLFQRYQALTSLLPAAKPKKPARTARSITAGFKEQTP
ncbi:class I SAM-dependent DNA methyltransferase [Thermomonas alba]|uniref:class I SAM-dependent DNA methyltransferase n=1 Tax=Thermomonas alba TaxID=2888525 RepID=UPI001F04D11F|nr:DNA methyltransferase [Thermomonas alba]